MNNKLSYRQAGVDIDAGQRLVDNIKPFAKATHRAEVLTALGGFGALFEIPTDRYQKPVLVSGTDGVGTKLKLAITTHYHQTIGIDLVAMCANDILTLGAEPLFFLDYYATGKLDVEVATSVVKGIAEGCQQAGMALIGGETAEMPGMYQDKDYDLAGFCVGVVEKEKIIQGNTIQPGDSIIGLASSGAHANGYSLIRKILEQEPDYLTVKLSDNRSLIETLLLPTKIYVKSILALLDKVMVKGLAHITGGGLLENIPRILPSHTCAQLQENAWPDFPLFNWLQEKGNLDKKEMYRTFNCGIGMVIIVSKQDKEATLQILQEHNETAWDIGEIVLKNDENQVIIN